MSLAYAWELRDASDDSVIVDGVGLPPDSESPGSALAEGSYYLWVEATDDGGSSSEVSSVAEYSPLPDPPEIPEASVTLAMAFGVTAAAESPAVIDPDPPEIPEASVTLAMDLGITAAAESPTVVDPDPPAVPEASVTLAMAFGIAAAAESPVVIDPPAIPEAFVTLTMSLGITAAAESPEVEGPGMAIWPDPSEVAIHVVYGPNGDDYIGTLVATGGTIDTAAIIAGVLAGLESSHVQITRIGPEFDPETSTITLIAGDDYLVGNGNAITFGITLPDIDLTGATAACSASGDYLPVVPGTAELIDTETETPKLRMQWTREQTSVQPSCKYRWGAAIIDADGLVKTIIGGPLVIKPAAVHTDAVTAALVQL